MRTVICWLGIIVFGFLAIKAGLMQEPEMARGFGIAAAVFLVVELIGDAASGGKKSKRGGKKKAAEHSYMPW